MAAWVYSDDPAALTALVQVEAWMRQVEAELSRFLPQSDLSRLNAAAGHPYPAGDMLWQVTDLALETARATGGRFDPTLGRAICNAGYDRSFDSLAPDAAAGRSPSHTPGAPRAEPRDEAWRQVRLDAGARTITLPPNTALDLGGIAKGWAADEALRLLAPFGSALVDAGGDLAVGAPPPDTPGWPLGILDPLRPDADVAAIQLSSCGLATSGTDHRRWQQRGRQQHHILDAVTGQPAATDLLTASVVAPSAVEADIHALVLVAAGLDAAQTWLRDHPQLGALLVHNDGTPYQSPDFTVHVVSYFPVYA